jgi:hypothetical protein
MTLEQLSREGLTMVVFLRHAGCTFCRQALADLSRQRKTIEAGGARLALVHMSDPLAATLRFERYGLHDVHRFHDPQRVLYRAFGLERGRFRQLFGPRVWWRGIVAGLWCGHGMGWMEGDGFQMPGVFVLYEGRMVASFYAATAADRPDYREIVRRGRVATGLEPACDAQSSSSGVSCEIARV